MPRDLPVCPDFSQSVEWGSLPVGVQIVCQSETDTNLTEQQQNLHCGAIHACPWMTQPSPHSEFTVNYTAKPSQTATFMFFVVAFTDGSPGTDVFPTSRLCMFPPSHLGNLHFANGDKVGTHPLLESTSASDDKLLAITVLIFLSPQLGHVLFVLGPSICFGQAAPVWFHTLSFCITALVRWPSLFANEFNVLLDSICCSKIFQSTLFILPTLF